MFHVSSFLRGFVLLGLCVSLWLSRSAAAEETPVALPPFFVEEASKGPPWRYADFGGYEVLSRCPDRLTEDIVLAHYQLHRLLAEVLPESLRVKHSVAPTLLICPEELQPGAAQEVIGQMMKTAPLERVRIEPGVVFGRGLPAAIPLPRITFLPNLRLWDRDGMAVFMIARRDGFEFDRLSLTTNYVHYLVNSRVPALPPWFVAGFFALYDRAVFEGGELVLRPIEWITPELTVALKRDPKQAPGVLPLADFFAMRLPRAAENEPAPAQRFRAQATLLVRWGLEGRESGRREALWKFAERCALERPTEALFRECFGCSFAEAEQQLAAFLPAAVKSSTRFRAPRAAPPRLTLRAASEAEIARIKGDWERLEIGYVRAIFPEAVPKYIEQARRTVLRAYEHGVREPAFLAVLGLCESDAGDDVAARPFLEEAAQRGAMRPRAACELGRLRLAAARAQVAPGEALSAAQVADVLTPLFAARAGEPPQPEVYELIAEVWIASAATPSRANLAVLNEGVNLFPRRFPLLQKAAEANLRHGYRAEAAAIIGVALRLAGDDATRATFTALQREAEKPAGATP